MLNVIYLKKQKLIVGYFVNANFVDGFHRMFLFNFDLFLFN